MSVEGPAREKSTRGRCHSGGRCQASPHRAPQSCTVPGIAAQWRAQVEGTPVTSAVWHDGRHQLTPPDTACPPPMPWSGWRVNAPHPIGRLGHRSSPPRAVSNGAGVAPAPRPHRGLDRKGLERGRVRPRIEGSRWATLERVGNCLRLEGPRRGALERGGDVPMASEALEGPYGGAGLWAERDLGFPCPKRLRASEFGKSPARVPYPVLRALRMFYPRVRVPHSCGTRQ